MKKYNCAIYTRKSSEEGLEQEFNSLDAQREACEAYVKSQKHAGWAVNADMYDDGGLSGGTMERPALKRLLRDIASGKVHIIVVYKVDRLTRSLSDFSKIVDVLDSHEASFVSVTQSFNTTTSMGRLTLNMLLSFAQFEREIAGERIRDKIAASKAKGMWMGGVVPLGYDVKERKLIVNDLEAATVREIFQRYAVLGSVQLLRRELDQRGVTSKLRANRNPRLTGARAFSRGALYLMLQNPIYRGNIAHKGKTYTGQHAPIVDQLLWQTVQDKLAGNRLDQTHAVYAEAPSLLTGLINDSNGHHMTPTHANKKGRRYRYYISASLVTGSRSDHAQGRRIPAGDIEGLVLGRMHALLASQLQLADAFAPLNLEANDLKHVLERAAELSAHWSALPGHELRLFLQSIVERVDVRDDEVVLHLKRGELLDRLSKSKQAQERHERNNPVILSISAKLRRAGKGTRLVIGDNVANKTDHKLALLIREAYATRQLLFSAQGCSISSLAKRSGNKRDNFTTLIRLSFLAPEIVNAILEGRQPVELTSARLIQKSKDLPHDWQVQWQYLGFAAG